MMVYIHHAFKASKLLIWHKKIYVAFIHNTNKHTHKHPHHLIHYTFF